MFAPEPLKPTALTTKPSIFDALLLSPLIVKLDNVTNLSYISNALLVVDDVQCNCEPNVGPALNAVSPLLTPLILTPAGTLKHS